MLFKDQRGEDIRRTFTKFDLDSWRARGGRDGREPYYDESGERQRVYVDARFFPTWREWKPEADRARDVALLGEAKQEGATLFGKSEALSGEPHFLVEKVYSVWRLWINVLCPSEVAFNETVTLAKQEAERRDRVEKEHKEMAAVRGESQESTLYCSLLNSRDKQTAELIERVTRQ